MGAATTHREDLVGPYVEDLRNVVDMDAIRAAGLKLAVDPLGGAAVHYWEPINRAYGLDIDVVNPRIDPTFSFDRGSRWQDPQDCPAVRDGGWSASDRYRLAFGNDPDADRHGIERRRPA
jgi:phosphoglucomutase